VGTAPGYAPPLAIVRRAISARQAVTISYTDGQGEVSIRHIRPLELEQRYQTWYLRAYCTTRRAERTFRVDRIAWIE
jgi:proteasome accessory factor C